MWKELANYIHQYLGCMVELDNGGSRVYNRRLIAVGGVGDEPYVKLRLGSAEKGFVHAVLLKDGRVRLMLRPMATITDQEARECWAVSGADYISRPRQVLQDFDWRSNWNIFQMAVAVKYLVENGFDVYGLIAKGWAVDKTKIKVA